MSSNMSRLRNRYLLVVNGIVYIGEYDGIVESICGPRLRLRFQDNSTWAESPENCVLTNPSGHPVSLTGPSSNGVRKHYSPGYLEASRRPACPPKRSYPS
ncbi:hypothetical protein GY45DRAFT_1320859 [Cubamyces sp. BRFM 1775]|nr:hypothetical protein GY45DRAFT_1320859 [Cubamyces sp. BRFM 1775]